MSRGKCCRRFIGWKRSKVHLHLFVYTCLHHLLILGKIADVIRIAYFVENASIDLSICACAVCPVENFMADIWWNGYENKIKWYFISSLLRNIRHVSHATRNTKQDKCKWTLNIISLARTCFVRDAFVRALVRRDERMSDDYLNRVWDKSFLAAFLISKLRKLKLALYDYIFFILFFFFFYLNYIR